MKLSLLKITALSAALTASAFAQATQTVTNPPPPAFSEDKPGFLYFREGTFTRSGKNRLAVDITMDEPMPSNLIERKVGFHFVFDIDNNQGTGKESLTFPGFGKDISAYILKEKGTNRFEGSSAEVKIANRTEDIRVSKVKVDGNKISCELSSDLFGKYDSLRVYVLSYQSFYERGKELEQNWIDQLPRRGAFKLSSE